MTTNKKTLGFKGFFAMRIQFMSLLIGFQFFLIGFSEGRQNQSLSIGRSSLFSVWGSYGDNGKEFLYKTRKRLYFGNPFISLLFFPLLLFF